MRRTYLIFLPILTTTILFLLLLLTLTNPIRKNHNLHEGKGNSLIVRNLEEHVTYLSEEISPRYFLNINGLDEAALYIEENLQESGCEIHYQEYLANINTYKNIICSFNKEQNDVIVLGAHYDVEGEKPGADDNASGVAGIIEVARNLGENPDLLNERYRYDIVAFTLEEPPFFRTEDMGSNVYVQNMVEEGFNIKYFINLEMIGYFSNEVGSQEFPFPDIEKLYGNIGDFIAIVGRVRDFRLTRRIKKKLGSHLQTKSLNAPVIFPGVALSDHRNFRSEDINAVMITDTSFYRNKNYHTENDTYETLNYEMMSKIVMGVTDFIIEH